MQKRRWRAPADGADHLLTTVDGIEVDYACSSAAVNLFLFPLSPGDTEYLSGDYAANGMLHSVQTSSSMSFPVSATSTANLDVIAWAGSVDTISRFDLGGYANGSNASNIWGLITPGGS
jgi:hypothetical protein